MRAVVCCDYSYTARTERNGDREGGGGCFEMGYTVDRHRGNALPKKDLEKGAEELRKFKRKVDAILRDLEDSPAATKAVAWQEITRTSLSGLGVDFKEADSLYKAYTMVHTELLTLSRTVGEQIEAIGIAVHAADIGFDNLEVDQQRRFWDIQQRAQELEQKREAERQRAEQKDGAGKHDEPKHNKKTSVNF
ncbi:MULTISPECIES: hypothetical protein [Streptomyces]|uniref:hypothetical protein n=1 Tax=Streptomyces TaxID=1883 RepID=UPI001F38E7E7|nr:MULTISPECIES: hypothetical protein [Streptomyces]